MEINYIVLDEYELMALQEMGTTDIVRPGGVAWNDATLITNERDLMVRIVAVQFRDDGDLITLKAVQS